MKEYAQQDAVGLARLVKLGEVKPLELLNTAIKRADAVNGKLNALIGDLGILYDHASKSLDIGYRTVLSRSSVSD